MSHSTRVRSTGAYTKVVAGMALGATMTMSVSSAQDAKTAQAEDSLEEIIVTGSLITDPNRESPSPIVITTIGGSAAERRGYARSGAQPDAAVLAFGHCRQRRARHRRSRHGQSAWPRRESKSGAARRPTPAARGHLRQRRHQPHSGFDPVERADDHGRCLGRVRLRRDVGRRQLHHARSLRRRDRSTSSTAIPSRAIAQQIKASLAFGTSFADERGHALLSLGYTDREGLVWQATGCRSSISSRRRRSSGRAPSCPRRRICRTRPSSIPCSRAMAPRRQWRNTLNLGFNDDGTLFTQTGARNYKGPDDRRLRDHRGQRTHAGAEGVHLQNPLERKSVFSKFDYEIGAA